MAEMTLIVCDVCGDANRHTSRYQITKGAHSAHFDLCTAHAAPVDAVLAVKGHLFTPDGGVAPAVPPRDELAARKAARR